MGTYGVGLYQDDDAADIKAVFEQLWRMGIVLDEARLQLERLSDSSSPAFWLVLADLQWKSGHIESGVIKRALKIIDSGEDLARWSESPKDEKARAKVLAKLKANLESPPTKQRKIPTKFIDQSEWAIGDLLAYPLSNGNQIVMRVVDYYTRFGGRSPIVEILDWYDEHLPSKDAVAELPLMLVSTHTDVGQFRFLPRELDQARLRKAVADAKRAGCIPEDVTYEEYLEHETYPFLPLIRVSESDRSYLKVQSLGVNSGLKRRYIPYLVNRVLNIYREWEELDDWLESTFAFEGRCGQIRRFRNPS